MAQYFDFGDQVGPLLQQALSNVEQKRQFTERQALEYMQLQEAANRFKEQSAEQKRQFDVSRGDAVNRNLAEVLNQIRDDYIGEDAVKALGIDPKRFKGYSESDISAPYKNIYGDAAPTLPAGRYYDRSTIAAAKASLEQERAISKLMAQMPISLSGADQIPSPKTITKNVVEENIEIPFSPRMNNQYFRGIMSRIDKSKSSEGRNIILTTDHMDRGTRSAFLAGIAQQIPSIDTKAIRSATFDPKTNMLKLTMLHGATDERGNPIPVEQYQTFDKGEVQNFFKETYPKLLASYNAMKSIDKGREEDALIELGGRLQQIVAEHPEYASQIAPFAGWAQRYQEKQAQFLMKLQSQQQIAAERQENIMLREAAKHDPALQEELANRARLLLQQQQLTQ